jgi:hypothetical protein
MSVQVTDSVTGSISITDNQSGSISQIIALSQSYAGSVSEYYPSFSASSGGSAVTLPISPVQFLYLKNTSTTIACSLTWTKNGGSSAGVLTLDPGAFVMFAENTTSNGITALTLTAASSTTAIQMVLAG